MGADAKVDQQAIEELVQHYAAKGRAVGRVSIAAGAVIGVLVGVVPLSPLAFAWPIPSSFGLATVLVGLGVGLLVGFVIGDSRARMYYRMAEQARAQLVLEERISKSDARVAQLVAALTTRARTATPPAAPQAAAPQASARPAPVATQPPAPALTPAPQPAFAQVAPPVAPPAPPSPPAYSPPPAQPAPVATSMPPALPPTLPSVAVQAVAPSPAPTLSILPPFTSASVASLPTTPPLSSVPPFAPEHPEPEQEPEHDQEPRQVAASGGGSASYAPPLSPPLSS